MSRIQIEIPEDKLIYKTVVPVLITHINYGNHLGYDSLLSILQEARLRFLKQHEMTEITIDGHVGFVVTNVALTYKSEAFHGDELEVMLGFDSINKTSLDFLYKVNNLSNKKLLALAKTEVCFYSFFNKKIAHIPNNFLKNIKNL